MLRRATLFYSLFNNTRFVNEMKCLVRYGLRRYEDLFKNHDEDNLVLYEKYSRKDIHDIFSPDTKFTPQTGSWGLQGIIRVPGTQHDYIFLVTYGKKQSGHEFDENIDENGILTWQSQPSQT